MNPDSKRRLQLVAGLTVFVVAVMVSYFSTSEAEIQEITVQDVFLVIDTSSSMADSSKLIFAKKAASEFVNILYVDKASDHKIGLISFSDQATQIVSLTNNTDTLNSGINKLNAVGNTAMGDGISLAIQLLQEQGRSETLKTIVLLSDGVSNVGVSPHMEAQNALSANIKIYSVGYGYDVDAITLSNIAQITNGDYFTASTGKDLTDIFDDIAKSLISPVSHYSSRIMMLVAIPILLFIPAIEYSLTTMMGLSDVPVKRNISNRKCSHCQHQNRQSAKFCLKCGKSMQQHTSSQSNKKITSKQNNLTDKQCPSCNHNNRPTSKFCLKCGKAIDNPRQIRKGDSQS